jgi:hypothetical protein
VVHVEHAPVARATVVASFWLEYVAHQAVSLPLVFIVTEMKAPKDRHLARISCHCLNEAPGGEGEEKVVNYKDHKC